MSTAVVWLQNDLRLKHNPILHEACEKHDKVLPLFIFAPNEEHEWGLGGASRWWLHRSLQACQNSFQKKKADLIIAQGPSVQTLMEIAHTVKADAVYWSLRPEPRLRQRDQNLMQELRQHKIQPVQLAQQTLLHPDTVLNKQNTAFKVYTPTWKRYLELKQDIPQELPEPRDIPMLSDFSSSVDIADLHLDVSWDTSQFALWQPGEDGAWQRLHDFCQETVYAYDQQRNFPAIEGTSRLSAHLRFGEISPVSIWQSLCDRLSSKPIEVFLKELVWREFAQYVLYHFPHTVDKPFNPNFEAFPWEDDSALLKAWQKGKTGFPIVDAAMRQLYQTGWMHNRLRMIVASFLVKDGLQHWLKGAEWFWDTLVDADLASNTLGWQWTAGCGTDAAPYFRVFNPYLQSKKFDPQGQFLRYWVPEISRLSNEHIHNPQDALELELLAAEVVLGDNYPDPILDHSHARTRALQLYESVKLRAQTAR